MANDVEFLAHRYPRRLSGFGALRTTWQASFVGTPTKSCLGKPAHASGAPKLAPAAHPRTRPTAFLRPHLLAPVQLGGRQLGGALLTSLAAVFTSSHCG
jgi:hypothetical protein